MTREEFIELVIEKAHEAWTLKERGLVIDMVLLLGRRDRATGQAISPTVNVMIRGKLEQEIL